MNINVTKTFNELFYADLRSLAALRVGVAITILLDLLFRSTSLTELYSNQGVLRGENLFLTNKIGMWSIHSLSGSVEFQAFMFILTAVFCTMLLVGFKTKPVTLVIFILLISLQNRNPSLLYGGDALLKMLVFWGIFIPWNARFSIDSITNAALRNLPQRVFSIGILGYFAQICFLYFFAGLSKNGPEWVRDYTAIYYTLKFDPLTTPLSGVVLAVFQPVLAQMTAFIRIIEIIIPFFLFFPVRTAVVRFASIISLVFIHLSFGAALYIGLFPLIDIVALLGLLPSFAWDNLFTFLEKGKTKLFIYYDSDCGLCFWFVKILKTFFLLSNSEIIRADRNKSIEQLMRREDSWIVEHKGKKYFKSKGLIPILHNSPILFVFIPLTKIKGIFIVGDKIYKFVSARRKRVCRIPKDVKNKKLLDFSFLLNAIALFFIIYILLWNIAEVNIKFKIPREIGFYTGIYQTWMMFAPSPPTYIWHMDITGISAQGEKIKLPEPASKYDIHNNYLWISFMRMVPPKKRIFLYESYAGYLCDENKKRGVKFKNIKIVMKYKKVTLSDEEDIKFNVPITDYKCE